MSTPSILVIGGGVAGLSTALRAAELGSTDVTVLEQDHLASGSSGLSAGVFNINATDPLNVEIRVRCRELLNKFEAENGLHLARIGHLRLAKLDEQIPLFESTVAAQVALGVEPSRILTPKEIQELVPDLSTEDLVAGLFNPRDGHMDGPLLCGTIGERAKAAGVTIRQKTRVEAIAKGATKRHLVKTDNGDYEADIIVNAAGAWADRIGDMLGCPVPLVSQLHEVVRVRIPGGLPYVVPMIQEYIPGYEEASYMRQDGPDSLIAGLHSYAVLEGLPSENPDDYAQNVREDYIEVVAEHVTARLPIDTLQFQAGWTGLYPVSKDEQYLVGPYDADPTVIACAGLGGQGLTAGVALGPLAAEYAVLGGAKSISGVDSLLPDRPSLQG